MCATRTEGARKALKYKNSVIVATAGFDPNQIAHAFLYRLVLKGRQEMKKLLV